jgi:translocator protein
MSKESKHSWLALVVLIMVCFAVGGQGGLITSPNITHWYAGLTKPTWTPPYSVFGPVWATLYWFMAVAAWLVWLKRNAVVPLILVAVQLVFNAAWSWLFFGLHSPGLGFVDILLLWIAIAATTIAFWQRSRLAGLLFVPYLAWVSFAAVLNLGIWRLNG